VKAVVQRVLDASVTVNGEPTGRIRAGLLVYLGVAHTDTRRDADWLAEKVAHLRIFADADGKMNLSLTDIVTRENARTGGDCPGDPAPIGVLAVSQFTLLGDARKGRRPSWGRAAPPEQARELYEYCMRKIREQGLPCESGQFQAHMKVSYTNDGPVTILLDSGE
jgi:D-tyrosyl-tRNA(Tyr) deacylase